MNIYNLEVYYHISYNQVTHLIDLIRSPHIDDIRYVWHGHDCPLTKDCFIDPVWMSGMRLAVVTFDTFAWPSIENFLIWFYGRIVESGEITSEIGQRWARKVNPKCWLCICQ